MHYNEKKSTWEQMKRVSYPIASGRDGGYRGFTSVDNPPVGDWKLRIINSDNRLIGEYAFRVATSTIDRVATSTNMLK